jgi:hypothetical protein
VGFLIKEFNTQTVFGHLRQTGAIMTIGEVRFNQGTASVGVSSKMLTLAELYRHLFNYYGDSIPFTVTILNT